MEPCAQASEDSNSKLLLPAGDRQGLTIQDRADRCPGLMGKLCPSVLPQSI